MNSIYQAIGTSKQNFHQRLDRMMTKEMEKSQILMMVSKVRKDHPRLSARQMYKLIDPVYLGRDRFEDLCFRNGYKLHQKRNKHRTTNSLGVTRFPNLLNGHKFTSVNQAWVSDITYYRLGEKFYYLTFIMDLYSRKIMGYSTSENLLTENTTIAALMMAIKNRPGVNLSGLILHSDGGGQYYSKKLLKITREHEILNSMCDNVYENAHAERLNGTIKNDYLKPYGPNSLKELKTMLTKAVQMYNMERPHKALGGLSPVAFEETVINKNEVVNKKKKSNKKRKSQLL